MAAEEPKTKWNSKILLWIVLSVLLLCACPIGVVGFLRAAAPAVSTAVQPTQAPNIGATVEIRLPTDTPGPTATATPGPLGQTREQPYPMGTPVDIGGGMELTVLGVERPADQKVAEGNMFNEKPAAGTEYMIVTVGVKCNKTTNEKCTFSPYEFKVVGADGQVKDQASVANVPGKFESFPEFFGGSVLSGGMVYLVRQGDDQTVLFYDPMFSEHLVYFSLQND